MERKKILYCFAGNSVFGYRDVEMFSQVYDVSVCHYEIGKTKMSKLYSFFLYNICVLSKIFAVKAVIINFGAWHAVFPVLLSKILGKKSMIILGGFDAGNIPPLNYGVFHSPSALQWWMRKTYHWVNFLCPITNVLLSDNNKYADSKGHGFKVGLLHFIPDVAYKIKIIQREIDKLYWVINEKINKKDILAIAYIYHEQTILVKGYDLIIECAKLMPEQKFTLAGFSPNMLQKYQKECPPNISLLGFQTRESARVLYQNHRVYLMPSMTESLGQALCEAMLCGCLPIGSRVGIIPDLIQNTSFIIDKKDKYALKNCIEIALRSDINPQIWRQNVIDYFGGPSRLEKFKELIET